MDVIERARPALEQLDLAEAKVYLSPQAVTAGPVAGHCGLPLMQAGLSALMLRLYVRDGRDLLLDTAFPAHELDVVIRLLPTGIKTLLAKKCQNLGNLRPPIDLGDGKTLPFSKPRLMGILNVTPDSFSDGGKFLDVEAAIRQGLALRAAGADIIDVGGESTRPGAKPVWEGDEKDRILPVVQALVAEGAIVSLDTRNSSVMAAGLDAGAHMINDISALSYDEESLGLMAERDCPVVLMHSQGLPQSMQKAPSYDHVLLDVYDALGERIDACLHAGIDQGRLIIDPGLGFGKRVVSDNLALMRGLGLFHGLGCPLLVGASRKRFIGATTGVDDAAKRLIGSVAAAIVAIQAGAQMVRVHDVPETAEALKFIQALYDSAQMDVGAING